MKSRFLLYTTLALSAIFASSCKKDEEETETKPYLYGVNFDLPTFAENGDSFELTAYGTYTEDGKDLPESVVYKWKVNSEVFQEAEVFELLNVQVGNYTIICQASDTLGNYYANSTTKTLIVIDPHLGKTLTGTGIQSGDDHITDPRGEKGTSEYYFLNFGGVDWFRNNLAYTGAGYPYEMGEVTSYPLGRYYTWDEAMTACPDGWRLPTDAEWAALGTDAGALMADAYLNETKMWEYWPQVVKSNSTRMAVIPSGYALVGSNTPSFKRLYDYAAFWTATENARDDSQALYRYLYVQDPDVKSTYGDKASLALSVRCVR